MKPFVKNLMKGAAFLTGVVLILALLSPLFTPKASIGSIDDEPENTLDYIVIGDSEGFTSIAPMELWRSNGFAGFNCGRISQRMQTAYFNFLDVLKIQSPKVVLLETNMIFRQQNVVTLLTEKFNRLVGERFQIYLYHDQWKRVFSKSTGLDDTNVFKGLKYKVGSNVYVGGTYIHPTLKNAEIGRAQLGYLDKIREECRERGIQLILYSTPSPKCWSYDKHNAVEQYAKQYSLEYVDMNLLLEDIGIDWGKDTYDRGDHLNFFGAQKVTAYMARYLAENTKLVDRRTDSNYSDWNDKLKAYLLSTNQTGKRGE